MNKKIIISLVVILALTFVGLFLFQRLNPSEESGISTDKKPEMKALENENIKIQEPLTNSSLKLPFKIKGEARVFENQLQYRLTDCVNLNIREETLTANALDIGQFGPFEITVKSLPVISSGNYCIEVFSYSAKDGSEINKLNIPITLNLNNNSNFNVFYSPQDPQDCSIVESVKRQTSERNTLAKTSIEELLKGPTISEREEGLTTNLNQFTKIQKLTIGDGVARIDFDNMLEEGSGGSCRALSIRSQIEGTLLQFPTINEVIISVDGNSEDILQP